jgi:hypothetical protein
MTASIRDQILDRFQNLGSAIPNLVAYRSREAAIARTEGPALLVRWDDEEVGNEAVGLTKRDLTVTLTFIARGTVPDKVADPLMVAMHAAIYADQTLGGLCARVIEMGTKPDFEVADQDAVAIVVSYRVRYLTPAVSLASLLT